MNKQATELIELAKRIAGYQAQRRWSDSATVKNLPLMGSTKTYKKILGGDLSELDLERQFNNYTASWESVKATTGDSDPDEPLFDGVYSAAKLVEAFQDIMETSCLARLIMVQGPTSSGKSASRRVLMRKFTGRVFSIEANMAWGDNPLYMFKAALRALGEVTVPQGAADCYELLINKLCAKRMAMIVEEAHHLGPNCLNMIKSIINNSPGEVITFAIDTLWNKLENVGTGQSAYEECRQLTSNRLHCRIVISPEVRRGDAIIMVESRLGVSRAVAEEAADLLLPDSFTAGRMAFLRNVCISVADLSKDAPVDMDHIKAARKLVLARLSRSPRSVKE